MSRKLTKQDIDAWLDSNNRGMTIIGEYNGMNTKTMFQCTRCDHQFGAYLSQIKYENRGCPNCGRFTKTSINEKLRSSGITMIGEYVDANTKTTFRCDNDHEWITRPSYIINVGCGCPVCSDRSLTKDQINLDIEDRGISLIGDYTTAKSKSIFQCDQGHTWEASVTSVKNQGSGCPYCSVYGYKTSDPGYAYVIDFGNFIKIGITNDSSRRLSEHKKQGMIRIIECRYYEDGDIPKQWERAVLEKFGGKYVTRQTLPDGWTETLPSGTAPAVIQMLQ